MSDYLDTVTAEHGPWRYWFAPTLFWINSSDTALLSVCIVGAAASGLIVLNRLTRNMLALAFVLHLSLWIAMPVFGNIQPDALILEVGLLAMFLTTGSPIVIWYFAGCCSGSCAFRPSQAPHTRLELGAAHGAQFPLRNATPANPAGLVRAPVTGLVPTPLGVIDVRDRTGVALVDFHATAPAFRRGMRFPRPADGYYPDRQLLLPEPAHDILMRVPVR